MRSLIHGFFVKNLVASGWREFSKKYDTVQLGFIEQEWMTIFTFKEFKAFYPDATLHATIAKDQKMVSIPYENEFIWVAKEQLTAKEQLLLTAVAINTPQRVLDCSEHIWYPYLFEHQPIEQQDSYRIIQVKFNETNNLLKTEWLQEIQEMLASVVDCFFLTEDYAVIIEKLGNNLPTSELDGLFVALDVDFDCYTHLFVGPFHDSSHDFTDLLKEEEFIFSQGLTSTTRLKCVDLAQMIIHFFGEARVFEGQLLFVLYQDWFKEPELIAIILSLWKNQGNASSTAKDLFMHRNTLLYKLDKFQTATTLNLKEMDALFLCYLLVKFFHKN